MKYTFTVIILSLVLASCTKTEIEEFGVFDPFAEEEEEQPGGGGGGEYEFGTIIYHHPANRIILLTSSNSQAKAILNNVPTAHRLCLSFDKRKLAFINDQGDIEIWDIQGNFLNTIDEPSTIADVNWAPDNNTLI